MSNLNLSGEILEATIRKVCLNPFISRDKFIADAVEILERANALQEQNQAKNEHKI